MSIFSRLFSKDAIAATGQTAFVSVIVLAANLFAGVITARTLGPDGRGELAALVTWPGLLASLFSCGIPGALTVSLKATPADHREFYGAALALSVLLGCIGIVGGYLLMPTALGAQYSGDTISVARWLLATTPLGVMQFVLMSGFQADHNFTAYNAVRYWQPILTVAVLAVLYVFDWITPASAAAATLWTGAPMLAWSLVSAFRTHVPSLRDVRRFSQRLLHYGLRAHAGQVFALMAGRFDRVILIGIFAPAMLGIYVVAVSLAQVLGIVSTSIASVLLPRIAGRPHEEVGVAVDRAAAASMVFILPSVIGMILVGPFLLVLLYGKDFSSASSLLALLALEAALSGIASIHAQAFMVIDRPGLVSLVQALSVTICTVLLLILPGVYGLVGAGGALLMGALFRFWLTALLLKRHFGLTRIRLWLPVREVLDMIGVRSAGARPTSP